MNKFLNNRMEDIREIIILTSNKLGLSEIIVEKDLWVSYVLQFLFSKSKYREYFQFKGGTSLSKAYNAINRFSEDIDIVLNAEVINADLKTAFSKTNNQRGILIENINKLALNFYSGSLIPEMEYYFRNNLKHKLEIYLNKEEMAIYIKYPASFDNKYIRNEIKIEIGPISAWNPHHRVQLDSYVYKAYSQLFDKGTYDVLVTDIERTFAEKLIILHRESNRMGNYPLRYSRHYYDTFKIYKKRIEVKDITDELIDDVRVFHEIFYFRKWAQFEKAKRGTFKLIPSNEYLVELKKDYDEMLGMIYKEDQHISFDEIIKVIKELEEELNKV